MSTFSCVTHIVSRISMQLKFSIISYVSMCFSCQNSTWFQVFEGLFFFLTICLIFRCVLSTTQVYKYKCAIIDVTIKLPFFGARFSTVWILKCSLIILLQTVSIISNRIGIFRLYLRDSSFRICKRGSILEDHYKIGDKKGKVIPSRVHCRQNIKSLTLEGTPGQPEALWLRQSKAECFQWH